MGKDQQDLPLDPTLGSMTRALGLMNSTTSASDASATALNEQLARLVSSMGTALQSDLQHLGSGKDSTQSSFEMLQALAADAQR